MPIKYSERCRFLLDNLDLEAASGVPGAKWEKFQLSHLSDDSNFRIEVKSRQIAWSWLCAAEATADALLSGRDSVFVSINQDESMEKIRYSSTIYNSLKIGGLPAIVRDSLTDIEFENGARLTSLTSRAPRGRARASVYLDEFAHLTNDAAVYTATLPIISKGGRLRIGSSPMGAIGKFWEIYTESLRPYPGFTRASTPWWAVQAFCTDVRLARHMAPRMPSEERVERFGNDRIKALFSNIDLESFQQEYEADFISVTDAWLTWEQIRAVQVDDILYYKASCYGNSVGSALHAIENLGRAIESGKIEGVLAGGMDVGRRKDATQIYFVSVGRNAYPLRLMIGLTNTPFETQRDIISYIMNRLPVGRFLIDKTGLGLNLAEDMNSRYPYKVFGVNFTTPAKVMWASDAKALMEQRKTPIPQDKDLAYELHSLKRIISGQKLIFDVDKTETKSHADRAWAWMLALNACKMLQFVEKNSDMIGQSVQRYW